ncbi:MAG TPA: gluconeogenesis factor YvcK family protein [Candidatus Eremiobacteraceae bacterium]
MRKPSGNGTLGWLGRWLSPGMHLKRWLAVATIGAFFFLDGFGRVLDAHFYNFHINQSIDHLVLPHVSGPALQWLFMFIGAGLMFFGVRQWMRSIVYAVRPEAGPRLLETIYEARRLNRGLRIAVVGGGTGLSTVLRGLKSYTSNLSAIVTVTDDGGSSGRLRQELGVLPPGDIRNCLVALADSESMMTDLFQYRFHDGNGLSGHSFGNLFIAAMCGIAGNFDEAIKESSRVLAIKGRVLPATLANVALEAELEDGTIVRGETTISRSTTRIKSVRLVPPGCQGLPEAIEAIESADAVVLGPGSLYTSVMPNLLVPGIAEAIVRSRGVKVYICNIMTQPGETDGMSASEHVRALVSATRLRLMDYALVNVQQPHRLLRAYEKTHAFAVAPDFDAIASLGVTPVPGKFLSETEVLRHDPARLGGAIVKLINEVIGVTPAAIG